MAVAAGLERANRSAAFPAATRCQQDAAPASEPQGLFNGQPHGTTPAANPFAFRTVGTSARLSRTTHRKRDTCGYVHGPRPASVGATQAN